MCAGAGLREAAVYASDTPEEVLMQLSKSFWEIAERFISYIHSETGYNTIVCDEKGVIRKAYVRSRIGQPHAGAEKILTTAIKEIAISKEDELRNPLTKEGVNCAIVIDGVKAGTFGITGKLENVTAVAHLAAMVMAGWVKQLQQQELLHATADQASVEISAVTNKIEAAIADFENVGQAMNHAVEQASASVASTGKIVSTVQDIADQTYMLSINANIEAGRLGAQGLAFSVVASEMGRLSQNTKQSLQSIQNTMEKIRQAIANVEAASRQSASLFTENSSTMHAVTPVVQTLVHSIQRLESSFKEDMH
jgi:sugar diacid utilization regulator